MATREEMLSVLEEMQGRLSPASSDNKLTSVDKRFIEDNFEKVKRIPFAKTSCGECYLDAMRQMLIHLRKNKLMEQSIYKLKNGVVLQTASDANVYTNRNLTDEAAERYLSDNPQRIGFFAAFPEDWEERIAKKDSLAASTSPKIPKPRKSRKVVRNDATVSSQDQE